jgi:hypothetical protein
MVCGASLSRTIPLPGQPSTVRPRLMPQASRPSHSCLNWQYRCTVRKRRRGMDSNHPDGRGGLNYPEFCVLTLECSAQTCSLNSLSRCNSKLRIISAKDAPLTGPEALNCHSHSEQPKPRKCLSSIHTSFRLMEGESYRPPFGRSVGYPT